LYADRFCPVCAATGQTVRASGNCGSKYGGPPGQIDVGGAKIAAGLVNRAGEILHCYTTHAHSEQQPEFVIHAIEQTYRSIVVENQIRGKP